MLREGEPAMEASWGPIWKKELDQAAQTCLDALVNRDTRSIPALLSVMRKGANLQGADEILRPFILELAREFNGPKIITELMGALLSSQSPLEKTQKDIHRELQKSLNFNQRAQEFDGPRKIAKWMSELLKDRSKPERTENPIKIGAGTNSREDVHERR